VRNSELSPYSYYSHADFVGRLRTEFAFVYQLSHRGEGSFDDFSSRSGTQSVGTQQSVSLQRQQLFVTEAILAFSATRHEGNGFVPS
jgi:hypothetical protein